jgi:uncharacterized membrane protein HdeD (DUF308 family)
VPSWILPVPVGRQPLALGCSATRRQHRRWRWLHIVIGVVGVLAGILTFAWPSITL